MRTNRPHYISKPIKCMAMFERLDMAQSIADTCTFHMDFDEKSHMVASIVSAMNYMEKYEPQETDEI